MVLLPKSRCDTPTAHTFVANLIYAAAALQMCGTSATLAQDAPKSAPHGEPPPLVKVANARGGQVFEAENAARLRLPASTPVAGAGVVVLDNYTNVGSTVGLNVSYQNVGSYDGSDPSNAAIVLPMAERLTARAPMDQNLGFLAPTDIIWNAYRADLTRWPGGPNGPQAPARLLSMSLVPYLNNTDPPPGQRNPRDRFDTLRVRFLSPDRLREVGGFDVVYNTRARYYAYFGEVIDLSSLDPPLMIEPEGYILLDWAETQVAGVGSMFAGGDFIREGCPLPDDLRLVGWTDTHSMSWADGLVGAEGWPATVDAAFDGDAASVSYLDIVNTGRIADWVFHLGDPPIWLLCRDFPSRLVIAPGGPTCECDVDASGDLNSQDFFQFIVGFFGGDADFNRSGATDSQDLFDFLQCFFSTC